MTMFVSVRIHDLNEFFFVDVDSLLETALDLRNKIESHFPSVPKDVKEALYLVANSYQLKKDDYKEQKSLSQLGFSDKENMAIHGFFPKDFFPEVELKVICHRLKHLYELNVSQNQTVTCVMTKVLEKMNAPKECYTHSYFICKNDGMYDSDDEDDGEVMEGKKTLLHYKIEDSKRKDFRIYLRYKQWE